MGQIAGIGRRTDLVGDDAQLIALGGKAEHGFDEVLAAGAVEPTGAQDEVAGQAARDDRGFAGPVAAGASGMRTAV